MEKTTLSTLVSLGKPITLPAAAKTVVKKKNALLIIPDSGKKILLFPTDSDNIVKISLELRSKGLSPLFFNEVGRITKGDLGVEILYTSGLCFAEEKCEWQGFFEDADKFKAPEEVKKKFAAIDGVNKVDIEFIKL
ncbi:MAG: hypothetical protein Q6373_012570 [Candidatus Sigynarchaeota archaeon]